MWKLKDNYNNQSKKEIAQVMKNTLEGLKNVINEVIVIEVGINQIQAAQAFDIVLYTEFNNYDDLSTYQKHPEHLKVVDYIRQVSEERVVVDYEI